MRELQIIKEVKPIIEINYTSVQDALIETLENYRGVQVVADNLQECKAMQKELASVRTKIDIYRKEVKKSMSEPITAFETQCKNLIKLVEDAEKPLKDGIKIYDDTRREEKRLKAIEIIEAVVKESGLNEKYAKRLDVIEKYCNLTATEKDVKVDAEVRAFALRVEQDREQELIDIIQGVIDTENERINTKLAYIEFKQLIDSGTPTKVIIQEIKQRALKIYQAENTETRTEAQNEPQSDKMLQSDSKLCYANFRIVEPLDKLKAVKQLLIDNGVNFTVVEQGVING